MLCEKDIEVINQIILDCLEVMQIRDIFYEEDFEYGNLPLELSISNYEIADDPEFIDDRAASFIEIANSDNAEYSISITNFNKRYAIKSLNANIFKEIDKYVDLDCITEFSIIKTNILNGIDEDLFQPVKNCLKRIDMSESYVSHIPKGLFRDLQLETMYVDDNTIGKSSPDFGLSSVLGISKSFVFSGNVIGNAKQLKLPNYIKNLSAKNVVLEDL